MQPAILRVLFLFASLAVFARAGDNSAIPLFRLGENERVVHLVSGPFGETGYAPRLEAMLLREFSSHGLIYRRVKGPLGTVLPELETRIFIHRPTVVLIQTGNRDLVGQRHYDFAGFPRDLETLVAKLSERRMRIIICSPTPVGSESRRGKLVFPVDGLNRWTNSAREIAARYHAPFVDLFSEAIEWPMIGNGSARNYYAAPEHEKSFALFCRQLRFAAHGSTATAAVDAFSRLESAKPAFVKEIERGQELAALLSTISEFKLPPWVKVEDFERQKTAALQRTTQELADHDARLAQLVAKSR